MSVAPSRLASASFDAVLAVARAEAALAVGTNDYAAFRGAKDARANTTRTLSTIAVDRDTSNPKIVYVTVRGNAFMYPDAFDVQGRPFGEARALDAVLRAEEGAFAASVEHAIDAFRGARPLDDDATRET